VTTTTVAVREGTTLRDVVEALAPLERRVGSSAEREAAEWLVARLREAGAHDARVGRHFPHLDRERTSFLNVETVGSPELVLMEGEGTVVMEDYCHRPFRDLVARVAERSGAPLRRGMRWRNSSDAVIPSRAGYPTATLASMNRYKLMSNYHLMSDTPDNLDFGTVGRAVTVTEAVARELAGH
jgi:hypothetical protein